MYIRPLGDRILIQPIQNEKTTESGIILQTESKDKLQEAEIIEIGQLAENKNLSKGDRIIYSRYAGTEVTKENKKYIVLGYKDIIAIIEK